MTEPERISSDAVAMLQAAETALVIAQGQQRLVHQVVVQRYALRAEDSVDAMTGIITRAPHPSPSPTEDQPHG